MSRSRWRAVAAAALCLGALHVFAWSHDAGQAYAATPVHIYVAGDSTASTYTTKSAGGITDNTHFQAYGGIQVARLIARSLNSQAIVPAADLQKLDDSIPVSSIVWPTKAPY